MKKGFGLLEVLVAALVLGFLIVGLNHLQLGNREAILRIRARDAANIIAQHVLDSLGAVGINSIKNENANRIIDSTERKYTFGGNDDKNPMNFYVKVEYLPSASGENSFVDEEIIEDTYLDTTKTKFAKNVRATVSWKFKNSEQSIKMDKVLR